VTDELASAQGACTALAAQSTSPLKRPHGSSRIYIRRGPRRMRASRAPPARARAQVAGSYAALAALLRAAGRGAEALAVARLAAAAQEGAAGGASPAAAAALLAVAEILADLGR
jgi:hypothetical protein